MVTSGVRLGAPAGTTRGFGVAEFQEVGRLIAEVLDGLAKNGAEGNAAVEEKVKAQAIDLCKTLPDLFLITSYQHVEARLGYPRRASLLLRPGCS